MGIINLFKEIKYEIKDNKKQKIREKNIQMRYESKRNQIEEFDKISNMEELSDFVKKMFEPKESDFVYVKRHEREKEVEQAGGLYFFDKEYKALDEKYETLSKKESEAFRKELRASAIAEREEEAEEARKDVEARQKLADCVDATITSYENADTETKLNMRKTLKPQGYIFTTNGSIDREKSIDNVAAKAYQNFLAEQVSSLEGILDSIREYKVGYANALYESIYKTYVRDGELSKFENSFRKTLLNKKDRKDTLLLTGIGLGLCIPLYFYIEGSRKIGDAATQCKHLFKVFSEDDKDALFSSAATRMKANFILRKYSIPSKKIEILVDTFNGFSDDEKTYSFAIAKYVINEIIYNKMISFEFEYKYPTYISKEIGVMEFSEDVKQQLITKFNTQLEQMLNMTADDNWRNLVSDEDISGILGYCPTFSIAWPILVGVLRVFMSQIVTHGFIDYDAPDSWLYAKFTDYDEWGSQIDKKMYQKYFKNFTNAAAQCMDSNCELAVIESFETYTKKYGDKLYELDKDTIFDAFMINSGVEYICVDKSDIFLNINKDCLEYIRKINYYTGV